MERVKEIMHELYEACEENNVSCLAIVGDDNEYNVAYTEDNNLLGESIYCALCSDRELYNTVSESVRIASEVMEYKEN